MSSVIRMETEQVLFAARQLDKTSYDIHQRVSALGNSLRNLHWQGGGREEFIASFQALEREIMMQAERGVTLSIRVTREVEEWLNADSGFGKQGIMFIAPVWQAQPLLLSEEEKRNYKWYKVPPAILGIAEKLIKNEKIKGKIPFIGVLFGIGEDMYEGDNFLLASSSEIIEGIINHATPIGLWGLVLAGAQIGSVFAEGVGYHDTAIKLQDFAEKADIVDHFSDSIADFYIKNPSYLLIGSNPIGSMFLAPEMQKQSFEFWSQELHTWGLHNQANWVQNTGNIVVENMKKYHPRNVFNNYFGRN